MKKNSTKTFFNLDWDSLSMERDQIPPLLEKLRYWALLFYAFSMPLVIYMPNTEYGYTKTIYTILYISFLLVVWVAEGKIRGEFRPYLTNLVYPSLAVLAVGLFSLINAGSKGVVLQSLALFFFFFSFLVLLANSVRTRREGWGLLTAVVAAALIASIYGFLQFYGLAPGPAGYEGGPNAMISLMGNQNYLGGFVSYLFLPLFVLIFSVERIWTKALLFLPLLVIFAVLHPIGSRGAWLGLIAGLIFFLIGSIVSNSLSFFLRRRKLLVTALIALALVYVFFAQPGPLDSVLAFGAKEGKGEGGLWRPVEAVFKPLFNHVARQGGARLEDWYVALEMFRDHPLFGVGLGNYKIDFLDYRAEFLKTERGQPFGEPIPRAAQAHNEYMQFLAELGILGVLAIFSLILVAFWTAFQVIRSLDKEKDRAMALAMTGGLIGFLVHGSVSFPAHLPASSLVPALFLGLFGSRWLNPDGWGGPRPILNEDMRGGKIWLTVLLLLTFVFAVSLSTIAYRDWQANILMGKGEREIKLGHHRLARDYLLSSLKLDFQPRQTYFYLGVVERQLDNVEKAIEYFERAERQFVPYKLHLHLGSLYLKNGQLKESREALEKFLAMGPESDDAREARYFLALLEMERGSMGKAESILSGLLDEADNFERGWMLLAELRWAQGKGAQAKKYWLKAREIINSKLAAVNKRLRGEMSLDRYNQLRSQKEVLNKEKERVNSKLDRYK